MNTRPLITLRDITVRLPRQSAEAPALRGITCALNAGRHLALLGDNGAGKSTLLRLMRGDIWATSGEILWHTAEGAENAPLAGRAMCALVSPAQHANYQRQGWRLSGRELLFTGFDDTPLIYSQSKPEQEAAIADMAARLRVEHLLDEPMGQFSQGQLRIMLLARALLRRPQVLLLDECTEGLDKDTRTHFLHVLGEVAADCTVAMTTHRADLLPSWFKDTLYLEHGRQRPLPASLYGGAEKNSVNGASACKKTAEADSPQPAAQNGTSATGQAHKTAPADKSAPKSAAPAQAATSAGRALITVRNATIYVSGSEDFDGVKWVLRQEGHNTGSDDAPSATGRTPALRGINWTLRQGEHWLIHGPNGAGKSTLLRLLGGDEYPAAGGSIERWLPRHGGRTTVLEDIRHGVRLVSDLGEALYSYDLTVLELICSGIDNTVGLYREYTPQEMDAARARLAECRLEALAERDFHTLSSGQLRLCFLARALMGNPDVLLLDEPCSGLDVHARAAYLTRLEQVAESGVQIVLVSHHDGDRIPAINHMAKLEGGRLTVEQ